ncbi:Nicotinate-nucleotide adenylyltransferase [Phycisphaerae bacterium RAS1]|nr:Nicotinate-nucleotide adenylyltransferase [Phycisphaerae bacterium RAS1]
MTDSVLLFGGTFDPIHNGHLAIARFAAARLSIPRVVLIPSGQPPHKREAALAAGEHRLAMCRLAVAGDELFEVSDWELNRGGPSYTLLTVQEFRRRVGMDVRVCWLIGADMLRDLGSWYRIGELAGLCTFVSMARPGVARPDLALALPMLTAQQRSEIAAYIIDGPLIDISATDIRQRVARGETIGDVVPESVAAYVAAHRLYASS